MSDIKTVPETYPVGTCPHCGRPLLAGRIYGVEINLECECQTEAREREEQRRNEKKALDRIAKTVGKADCPELISISHLMILRSAKARKRR